MSEVTAYQLAQRYVGVREIAGISADPQIIAMLRLDNPGVNSDEVPWCSAFINFVAWQLRLPRSKSLAARSWLTVGQPIELDDAIAANDVVILNRGKKPQPDASVIKAHGYVGFFAGVVGKNVILLSGNSNNSVALSEYAVDRILGIRRLS